MLEVRCHDSEISTSFIDDGKEQPKVIYNHDEKTPSRFGNNDHLRDSKL